MNRNRFLAFLLSIILLCCCATGANAVDDSIPNFESSYVGENIAIFFEEGTSDYAKSKIISDFTSETNSEAEPCGLTCTLFGHKLETGSTSTITHKVKSSAPRCLREFFDYEVCTRCDYSNYTLLSSVYINCC